MDGKVRVGGGEGGWEGESRRGGGGSGMQSEGWVRRGLRLLRGRNLIAKCSVCRADSIPVAYIGITMPMCMRCVHRTQESRIPDPAKNLCHRFDNKNHPLTRNCNLTRSQIGSASCRESVCQYV